MSPIPWAAILTHGPTIVAAARSLLDTQSRSGQQRHQSLEARIEELEKTSVQTARLVNEMAEQLQALTLAQQELQRRFKVALILSLVSLTLGTGVLIYVLGLRP
jgi:hypothetical protein